MESYIAIYEGLLNVSNFWLFDVVTSLFSLYWGEFGNFNSELDKNHDGLKCGVILKSL